MALSIYYKNNIFCLRNFFNKLFFLIIFFEFVISAHAQSDKPILRLNSEMHTARISRISSDATGKYILTASDDKTAKLWNAQDGSLIRTYRVPIAEGDEGMLYAGAISPDGETVAVGGNTGKQGSKNFYIYLFHTHTGEIFMKLEDCGNKINDLEYSPDANYLAVGLGGGEGIRVYNTQNWEFTEIKDYGGDVFNIAFDENNRLASVCYDGYIRLYNYQLGLIKQQKLTGGNKPHSLTFCPDNTKIAVGYADTATIEVFDAYNLELLFKPDISKEQASFFLGGICFSFDGRFLYAGGSLCKKYNEEWKIVIRRWSLAGMGNYGDEPVAGNTIMDIKALPNGKMIWCGSNPDFGMLSAKGKSLWQKQAELNSLRAKDRSHLKINNTGTEIGFTPFEKNPLSFKLNDKNLFLRPSIHQPYTDETGGVKITEWQDSYSPKLNGIPLDFLEQNEWSRSVDINTTGKGVIFGANWNLYYLDHEGKVKWKKPTQAMVSAVNISGNGKVVVAAMGDGTIRWYSMSDGKLLHTLFVHPDNQHWVIWTPSGYYDASPGGEDLIGWHLNNGNDKAAYFYPASKFRKTYYRPDIIDNILKTYNEEEAISLANEASNKQLAVAPIEQTLPPVINILSPVTGTTLGSKGVKIVYQATSPNHEPITQVIVQVDGRPVKHINSAPATNSQGESEISLTLEESSRVSIIAQNRHGYSDPASVQLNIPAAKGSSAVSIQEANIPEYMKPKLYALVVGVNNYSDDQLSKLGLAVKDANDFAAILQKQKGILYGDVQVKLFTDEKASKDNVLDGLEWLEKQVTQKDVGVIFLSGIVFHTMTGDRKSVV